MLLLSVAMPVTAMAQPPADDCSQHLPLSTNTTAYTFSSLSTSSPTAKALFNQGLMMCMGFNQDEAVRSFTAAAQADPGLCMAQWGLAFALSPDINRNVTVASRLAGAQKAAAAAVHCAASSATPLSPIEQTLIDAMAVRMPAARTLENGWPMDVHYAKQLDAAVAASSPLANDPDALVLSAEAWMTTTAWFYYDPVTGEPFDWVPRARSRLDQAIALSTAAGMPHPLALHLRIHLIETLAFEPEVDVLNATGDALRALMPDNAYGLGHLIHMPSHVYLLVGRWEDATQQNLKAVAADEGYFKVCPTQAATYNAWYTAMYRLHRRNFLGWTAGMEGRAQLTLDTYKSEFVDPLNIEVGAQLVTGQAERMPWLVQSLVRFGRWSDILAMDSPNATYPYLVAHWRRARAFAMAAASPADCAGAAAEVGEFTRIATDPKARASMAAWGGLRMVSLANLTLAARMAERCGSTAAGATAAEPALHTAVALWTQAVAAQDALGYSEPPLWPYSIRPCLASALMAANETQEAVSVLQEDLRRRPNNGWAFFGLAQAYEAMGDGAMAAQSTRQYQAAWVNADAPLTTICN